MTTQITSIFDLAGAHLYIAIACSIVLAGILITAAIVDIRTRNIPNIFVLLVLLLGIAASVLTAQGYAFPLSAPSLLERFAGAVIAFVPVFIIGNKMGGIGGGDIKLLTVLGFLFGIEEAIAMLVCTCIIGACAGIVKLIANWLKTESDTTFAYAPCIAAGALITLALDLFFRLF